jgi:hypothetical protein
MSIEAMKQALEALERYAPQHGHPDDMSDAITALRTAIEQAEKQEPVGQLQDAQPLRGAMPWEQLYPQFGDATPPAAAQRQPLTKEQLLRLCGPQSYGPYNHKIISFARAVEAAHGIKETNT